MKEFTVIYFNDDGCGIYTYTLKELNKFLKDIIDVNTSEGGILSAFISDVDKSGIDTAFIDENQKYMIIKGLPIKPKIVESVLKLSI